MIKKIGVLTSGGDAPGMNAAISAVIKSAISKGLEAYIVRDGYKGLVNNWIEKADVSFASDIIWRGGTIIGSARLPEFKQEEVRKKAVENLNKLGIEALVVIGGDGSYRGAEKLTKMGINCVGLPGTIDNDIVSTNYTIGFDTALNTVIHSLDQIRDTIQSHNRCMVVEIMGNGCGDLTLYGATCCGAEVFSSADSFLTEEEIIEQVKELRKNNKRSVLVAIAEKIYDANSLAKRIEQETGYETRSTILGHVQRGGKPTAMDRFLAVKMGMFAVDQLLEGKGGLYIGIYDNKLVARDIESTLNMPKADKTKEYERLRAINKVV